MPKIAEQQMEWLQITDKIVETHEFDPSTIIAILQDVQKEVGYLPKDVLRRIAVDLDIPISRVYSVATFYSAFKLKPTGKHIVKVCLGTACHIKGGPLLMQALENVLRVKAEEVTEDGLFSYEGVRCVGCCGLAPVIMIDENFHGKVKPKEIKKILAQYR